MKKIFRSFAFLFFCFNVSCISHELTAADAPPSPPPGGKADGTTSDFKKNVEDALAGFSDYKIFPSSVPIGRIWDNINYNGFDYETFFYNTCPTAWQQGSGSYLACDYQDKDKTRTRKFSISVYPEKIVVDIKELSFENSLFSWGISALWEIEGNADDFIVKKFEVVRDKKFIEYIIISTRYIKNKNEIIAKGQIGSADYGVYFFETKDVIFTKCNTMPGGKIIIYGSPETQVNFFESRSCGDGAPIIIGGLYGKFAYRGPFGLRDLFDYLHLYTQ